MWFAICNLSRIRIKHLLTSSHITILCENNLWWFSDQWNTLNYGLQIKYLWNNLNHESMQYFENYSNSYHELQIHWVTYLIKAKGFTFFERKTKKKVALQKYIRIECNDRWSLHRCALKTKNWLNGDSFEGRGKSRISADVF